MNRIVNKTVRLDYTKYKNYELLGVFIKQAQNEGWSKEEIDSAVKAVMDSNAQDFTTIIRLHCIN
jgi:hypothetical protein